MTLSGGLHTGRKVREPWNPGHFRMSEVVLRIRSRAGGGGAGGEAGKVWMVMEE